LILGIFSNNPLSFGFNFFLAENAFFSVFDFLGATGLETELGQLEELDISIRTKVAKVDPEGPNELQLAGPTRHPAPPVLVRDPCVGCRPFSRDFLCSDLKPTI
jgi:hypothetical protein